MSTQADADLTAYVVAVGGPLDGRWWSLESWTEYRAASTYMAAKGQRRSDCLDYQATDAQRKNPDEKRAAGLVATEWRYKG